jgi:hypothetical protein
VIRDRVKRDFLSGVRSGLAGTPTFFINGYDGSLGEECLASALRPAMPWSRNRVG